MRATRIKFKKSWKSIKENAGVPIAATSLAVSAANFATNKKRHDKDREYQDKQLEAMNRLTNQLGKVDTTLSNVQKKEEKKPSVLVRYRKKVF